MIKYYVRTTGERELDSSFSQIEFEYLYDREHKKGEIYAEQLKEVSNTDIVLLEDDIILCKGFKEKIESVIKEHQLDVINFFTLPFSWIEPRYMDTFCYNQCIYIPQQYILPLSELVEDGWEKLTPHHHYTLTPEPLMRYALNRLNIPVYIHRPCLVQHIDDGSLMEHYRLGRRRCIYFEDYLNQLGIDYNNAKLNENRIRLKELMTAQFADIDSKCDYSLLHDCREPVRNVSLPKKVLQ